VAMVAYTPGAVTVAVAVTALADVAMAVAFTRY
jgi:hypothetical protein